MNKTKEGANAYEHAMDHALEFFSKAGSLFQKKQSYYGNEESALSLFQKIWIVDKEVAFKLLLWVRDCRGGAGNRSAFRSILKWLGENPEYDGGKWIFENINWIPKIGRWDDLRSLFNTPLENLVSAFWAGKIRENDILAAKWADRKDKPIKHALGIKEEGKFRKLLSDIRKKHIVEHKMCTKLYNQIDYEKVPSVAMSRYTKAFSRNDMDRFNEFKDGLVKGEKTIKADVLFPHDCVRTVKNGDRLIADKQFQALPNYFGDSNERIMCICDTSSSMGVIVTGNISACDVSQGLSLYCSAKIPNDNPFHKKFISFCGESRFIDWSGISFSKAVKSRKIFNGAIGSTRIDIALMSILKQAKYWKLTNDQIPSTLLILSDMQFHYGIANKDETEVNACIRKWEDAGYNAPKIVYWNLAGYAGSPETAYKINCALVSGFSPSVLRAFFNAEDFSPLAIMRRTLDKYDINIPK